HLLVACNAAAQLYAAAVPRLDFAEPLADAGLVPGGSKKNLRYAESWTRFAAAIRPSERQLLADAQTSGGLLIAVAPSDEARLLAELERRGAPARARVGELVAGNAGTIEVVASPGR
ncbi:MAG: selenide, water dikinase SelD, partial [Deltaproteobacteria bacterium]